MVRPLLASLVLLVALVAPGAAQSTGPSHPGYDPNAPTGGHYHDGPLGEKLLALEQTFKCNCGCGLDLHSCQFQMQCGTSPVWSQRIRAALEAGDEPEAIRASFVADFGTQVLMTPPAEGFNLVGYFLPGVAILTAGILVGLIARGGTRREALVPAGPLSEEDDERLREALRQLDESEGPDW